MVVITVFEEKMLWVFYSWHQMHVCITCMYHKRKWILLYFFLNHLNFRGCLIAVIIKDYAALENYERLFCNKCVASFTGMVMSALSRNVHCMHLSHHIVFNVFPLCKWKLLFDWYDAFLKQYKYFLLSLSYKKLRLHIFSENRGHSANGLRKIIFWVVPRTHKVDFAKGCT